MMSSEIFTHKSKRTKPIWFNCALQGDEAVYILGQKRAFMPFYIEKKWRSDEVLLMPNSRADFEK